MNKIFVSLLLAVVFLFTAVFVPNFEASAVNVDQKITPVSGGLLHTIVLADIKTVWAWGSNNQFQLGMDGSVKELATPQHIDSASLPLVESVSAGYCFSLALKYDYSVYVLGEGGDTPIYNVPFPIDIVAIAAGHSDGLALDKDGYVWQWTVGETPEKLSNLAGIAAITAGATHYFALTHAGEVWAWGNNEDGQLGDGTTTNASVPKKIDSLANIVFIAAGYSHSLAVAHNGAVYAWGSNAHGQLGDGSRNASRFPMKINGITNAIQASAGNDTSMVLTSAHEIYTWGYGEYGQLGNGTTNVSQVIPAKIEVTGVPEYIASGFSHNLYVTTMGDLYVWGSNKYNQLGTGKSSDETKPLKMFTTTAYINKNKSNPISGASAWAVPELTGLHSMDLLPPMLWSNYRNNVTRAEFAGLLVNTYEALKKTDIAYPDNTNFTDIASNIYRFEIRKAFEIKLVSGISETRYNPEGNITRQEAAKMICTFVAIMEDFPPPSGSPSLSYYKDDYWVDDWAKPFVDFAYLNNIMQGSDGYFHPIDNLTREQILVMVYRTLMKYGWV